MIPIHTFLSAKLSPSTQDKGRETSAQKTLKGSLGSAMQQESMIRVYHHQRSNIIKEYIPEAKVARCSLSAFVTCSDTQQRLKFMAFLCWQWEKGHTSMQQAQKLMNTLAVAQPLIPATGKHLQPLLSQVAIQKGKSQPHSYHIHDEKRNSFRVKTEVY